MEPDGLDRDPDDDFDFSSEQAARESMRQFVKENFGDLLGDQADLLDDPDWPEKVRAEFASEIEASSEELPRNINKLMSMLRSLKDN